MLWVEASIAFAAVMMVLSTFVTVIIEVGHRFFRSREQGLRQLMAHMYQDVLIPQFGETVDYTLKHFQEDMVKSDFLHNQQISLWQRLIKRIINAKELTALETGQFVERLALTPFADKIEHISQNQSHTLSILLNHITRQYYLFGESASVYFKRRAGFYSLLGALCLVFSFNINCVDLFYSLVELSAWINKLMLPNTPDLFPIGWDQAPWYSDTWHSGNGLINQIFVNALPLAFWVGTLLVTAAMIGLGGPFWFDLYKKLSMFVELRNRQGSFSQIAEKEEADWGFVFQQVRQAHLLKQTLEN